MKIERQPNDGDDDATNGEAYGCDVAVMGIELASAASAAAPATPSYQGVERTIQVDPSSLVEPGAAAQPNRPGWDALFDALLDDLRLTPRPKARRIVWQRWITSIRSRASGHGRLAAGREPARGSQAVASAPGPPGVGQAPAERDGCKPCRPPAIPNVQANRSRWVDFVQNDLGNALRDYDAAATVAQRRPLCTAFMSRSSSLAERKPEAALVAVVGARGRGQRPVQPAQSRHRGRCEHRRAALQRQPGRDRAGPAQGIRLAGHRRPQDRLRPAAQRRRHRVLQQSAVHQRDADLGLSEPDRRGPAGPGAAKLYQFSATTYDWAELTITTVLKAPVSDLAVLHATRSTRPSLGADRGWRAGPRDRRPDRDGPGEDQRRRSTKGRSASSGSRSRSRPRRKAQERIAAETAKRNADLRAKGLVGNDTVGDPRFPDHAALAAVAARGRLRRRPLPVAQAHPGKLGADAPQPRKLATTRTRRHGRRPSRLAAGQPGGRASTSASKVRSVKNLMIVIKDVPPGTPPRDAVKSPRMSISRPIAKAVDDARKPKPGSPKDDRPADHPPAAAARVQHRCPGVPGRLIHDLQLDVPAPEEEAKGGIVGAAAKIYRIKMPLAEVALSYQVDSSTPDALQLQAKVEDFNSGHQRGSAGDHRRRNQGRCPLAFSAAFVLGAIGGKIRTQPIDACPRPAQAAGLLDPLDLAARPQRLDAGGTRSECRYPVPAG